MKQGMKKAIVTVVTCSMVTTQMPATALASEEESPVLELAGDATGNEGDDGLLMSAAQQGNEYDGNAVGSYQDAGDEPLSTASGQQDGGTGGSDAPDGQPVDPDATVPDQPADPIVGAAPLVFDQDAALAAVRTPLKMTVHGGVIKPSALRKALNDYFKCDGFSKYRIMKDGAGIELPILIIDDSAITLEQGSYTVDYYKVKFGGSGWETVGTLEVGITWDVTFAASGLADPLLGGVQTPDTGEVLTSPLVVENGADLRFATIDVPGYRVASVTVGDQDVPYDNETGVYELSGIASHTAVVVSYEALSPATLQGMDGMGMGTLTVNGAQITAGASMAVAAGQQVVLNALPADGHAIESIAWESPDGSIEFFRADDEGGLSFGEGRGATVVVDGSQIEEGEVYKVGFATVEAGIALKEGAKSAAVAGITDQGRIKQRVFEAAVDGAGSVPVLSADDVTIEYLAYTILGQQIWLGIDAEKPDWVNDRLFHAFGTQPTETVRFSYAGDERFPALTSEEVELAIEDGRTVTELVLNEGVQITYGDAAEMDAALRSLLVARIVDAETGVPIAYDESAVTLSYTHAAGTQEVTVSYAGSEEYQPCSGTATVYIAKAPATITVNSQTIRYGDELQPLVSVDPADAKSVYFIAGLDAFGNPYVSVNFAQVTINDIAGEKVPIFGEMSLQDIAQGILGDTVTLNGLLNSLDAIEGLLEMSGIEDASAVVSALRQAIDAVNQVAPGLADAEVSIGGIPANAGVYSVVAFTANQNYRTAFGMGYLIVGQQNTGVELAFEQKMGDQTALTVAEAIGYNYAAAAFSSDDGSRVDARVRWYFIGIDENGEGYNDTKAPTVPGTYVQTAYVLGGNYYADPIARTYTISRTMTEICFVDGDGLPVSEGYVFDYDGNPHGIEAEVLADGLPVEGAVVAVSYGSVGRGDAGFGSDGVPCDAGSYLATVTFAGDDMNAPCEAQIPLTINAVPVSIVLTGVVESTYGEEPTHDALLGFDGALAVSGPISKADLDAVLATLACACDGKGGRADVGTYAIALSVPDAVANNTNYTTVGVDCSGATHRVLPRTVYLDSDGAQKVAGETDPAIAFMLVDGQGGILSDADALAEELGAITYWRTEGEDPGVYPITGVDVANDNYRGVLFRPVNLTIVEKPAEEIPGEPGDKPGEPGGDQPGSDKPGSDKPGDQPGGGEPGEPDGEQPGDKPGSDKPADKPANKPAEKPGDQIAKTGDEVSQAATVGLAGTGLAALVASLFAWRRRRSE